MNRTADDYWCAFTDDIRHLYKTHQATVDEICERTMPDEKAFPFPGVYRKLVELVVGEE